MNIGFVSSYLNHSGYHVVFYIEQQTGCPLFGHLSLSVPGTVYPNSYSLASIFSVNLGMQCIRQKAKHKQSDKCRQTTVPGPQQMFDNNIPKREVSITHPLSLNRTSTLSRLRLSQPQFFSSLSPCFCCLSAT